MSLVYSAPGSAPSGLPPRSGPFFCAYQTSKKNRSLGAGAELSRSPDERFLAKKPILADDSHRGGHGKIDLGFVNVIEEIREGVDRDSANHFDNCGIVVTRHLELFELLI